MLLTVRCTWVNLWLMHGLSNNFGTLKARAAQWLRQGMTPRQLALTLALGFVIGCLPLLGIPTALCALVALTFRLNQPVIQAANYLAMPFQVALIVPFMRLGSKLTPAARAATNLNVLSQSPWHLVTHSSAKLLTDFGLMAGQALLAWLLVAIPVVLVLTLSLTPLLRRVPVMAAAEAGD